LFVLYFETDLGCYRGRFGCFSGRVLRGASTVFWDLSFMWVLGVMSAFWLGGLDGFFCCFWGFGFVRALLYTACVRRGVLRFFNKLQPYLSKKKYSETADK
jgi:hypothetical protein